MASRKSENFSPIIPLMPADITNDSVEELDFNNLLNRVRKMREELKSKIAEFNSQSTLSASQTNPAL